MPFQGLGLAPVLCQNLSREGYTEPTPIQSQAIPIALAGRDLMGGAQTGTGKTAAFALPMIQRLLLQRPDDGSRSTYKSGVPRHPWGLVLAPVRELALQVNEALVTYGRDTGLRTTAIYGGVGMQPQVNVLRRGVHVVVATPGRLLDHLGQGTIRLSEIEILVIDEADRMLDLGFLPDLKRILRVLPEKRQTMLFSATLSESIQELARQFLVNPERVQVAPRNAIASLVQHRMHPVEDSRKRDLLVHILSEDEARRSLVFCRTKSGSDRLTRHLAQSGFRAVAIHGNKSQTARIKALNDFKSGRTRVLVATDIAARGLDIEELPIVINFDLPLVPEDYIHRIGRTGRAGIAGQAISLVTPSQSGLLNDIRRLLKDPVEVETVPGFDSPHLAALSRLGDSTGSGGRGPEPRRNTRSASSAPRLHLTRGGRPGPERGRERNDGFGPSERGGRPKTSSGFDPRGRDRAESRPAPRRERSFAEVGEPVLGLVRIERDDARDGASRGGVSRTSHNGANRGGASRTSHNGESRTGASRTGHDGESRTGASRTSHNDASRGGASRTSHNDANRSGASRASERHDSRSERPNQSRDAGNADRRRSSRGDASSGPGNRGDGGGDARRGSSHGRGGESRGGPRTEPRGPRNDSRGPRKDAQGSRNDSRGHRTDSQGSRPGSRTAGTNSRRDSRSRPDDRSDRRNDSRGNGNGSRHDQRGSGREQPSRSAGGHRHSDHSGADKDDRGSSFTQRMSEALRSLLT